ncbi:DUF4238 domain-containing protein [Pediococcus pentosaceus]|nr:DUF4238 domain-containing protein [Pediococcus pentosaceus]
MRWGDLENITKKFVKKQHYIPRFALKYFTSENGKISYTNIRHEKLRLLMGDVRDLMQEKNFYEVKNDSNEYILRNRLEKQYGSFEASMSSPYKKLLKLLDCENYQQRYLDAVADGTWARIDSDMLLYLIFSLIRGKVLKNSIFLDPSLNHKKEYILYLQMTTSSSNAAEYAKRMYAGNELEDILFFLKSSKNNILQVLVKHILSEYRIRVYKTTGNKKFFLSDNPVIIKKFKDEDYVLPISSEVCISFVKLQILQENVLLDSKIQNISDYDVNRINQESVKNTDKLLIINNADDLKFVKDILKSI